MTPERWERIQELDHASRARPDRERARFLAGACGSDDALRREVQALLDQPVATSSFVDFLGGPAPRQLESTARPQLEGRRLGSYAQLPGARRLTSPLVPGPSSDEYAFYRTTTQRNLYRIPIR